MKKYYILKNNTPSLLQSYLREFGTDKIEEINSRLKSSNRYILVEKTIFTDDIGTSEHYTNLWTIPEGVSSLVYDITKDNVIWDYTGFVEPLIHVNKVAMRMEEYNTFISGNKS